MANKMNGAEIAIDKGVPLPAEYRGRSRKYPFPDMQVGDSFFVTVKAKQAAVITQATTWAARQKNGFKFKTAAENGGFRIWRVA